MRDLSKLDDACTRLEQQLNKKSAPPEVTNFSIEIIDLIAECRSLIADEEYPKYPSYALLSSEVYDGTD